MSENGDNEDHMDDTMKILVATDIHLGYQEKDPILHEDSFIAFEEILGHAITNEVDLILLGGDLFHDAIPSPNSLNRCIKLLRTYVLGDKSIEVEFLSDQTINFAETLTQTVNYEDPNMNIALPVYSIHGNHDDTSGFGRLSSLDILSSTGLINYFGKWTDLTKIHLDPIILRKGKTQIALYGLSHIHDPRLVRLFLDSKVTFQKPAGSDEEWFHLMVIHQNRADRGIKNYLPEESLPKFLNLVIWGHEHDCRITPEQNAKNGVFITQPGSSVATSLSEGESLDKHCGLLLIRGDKFKLEPIKLKTVRPFIFDNLNLEEYKDELNEGEISETVKELCINKINEMIEKSKEKITGVPKQPTLPLIRLRVMYFEEDQIFNAVKFGQQFSIQVANPKNMITFIKNIPKKSKSMKVKVDESALSSAFVPQDRVEDVVDRYFAEMENEDQKLELFHSKTLSELCRRLVDNDDDDAADIILKRQIQLASDFVQEKTANADNIQDYLRDFRDFNGEEVHKTILAALDVNPNKKTLPSATSSFRNNENNSDSDDDSVDTMNNNQSIIIGGSRGRANTTANARGGRGRGRGARGARGAASNTTTVQQNTKLNVRVNRNTTNSRSTNQQTISSFMSQTQSQSQRTGTRNASKKPIYVSDSDSD